MSSKFILTRLFKKPEANARPSSTLEPEIGLSQYRSRNYSNESVASLETMSDHSSIRSLHEALATPILGGPSTSTDSLPLANSVNGYDNDNEFDEPVGWSNVT
jgi:hypothetical protein